MAHPNEHRDAYIAAIVGGLGLVLVLLYLFGGSSTVQTNASGDPVPTLTDSPPPFQTAYNYNIAPYQPETGLTYAKSSLPANNNGGGCCDSCGPGGSGFNTNVAQYVTLLGPGAG